MTENGNRKAEPDEETMTKAGVTTEVTPAFVIVYETLLQIIPADRRAGPEGR